MNRFIPQNKLSKKAKRALYNSRRSFWVRSPVTRCPPKPGTYDRNKVRNDTRQVIDSAAFSSSM